MPVATSIHPCLRSQVLVHSWVYEHMRKVSNVALLRHSGVMLLLLSSHTKPWPAKATIVKISDTHTIVRSQTAARDTTLVPHVSSPFVVITTSVHEDINETINALKHEKL